MENISVDRVCYIAELVREYSAEVPPILPESSSNSSDDGAMAVLEDTPDNPIEEELQGALEGLSEYELADLLALAWLGRGDYLRNDWDEAVQLAQDRVADGSAVQMLTEMPLLSDYLEDGLQQFDYSCREY